MPPFLLSRLLQLTLAVCRYMQRLLIKVMVRAGYGQYPPQRAGSNSSGAIPADAFGQPAAAGRTVSDLMGREIITKKDTFDFVGDHLDTLKITK